ncbi:uncharacterized protein LOC133206178 [Saccostrea echinata]|uniref:uncharacterized protein LOC133206178 n=1 Tax=Saccostrea echinata TaxID=191078 RepID=UPI002A83D367|nr:uncharacterized protein LOC133206178 [Saccostrea echinata]
MIELLMLTLIPGALGHGYLQDPPSRSSMWRFGFNTPHNYDDNQLFCGGFDRQWNKNGGKCGICGDPWDGVRENEAGGRYATGIISKRYTEGQIIDVKVKITASHLGYFEFRLCPNNNVHKPATQACLDQYVLHQPSGSVRFMEQGRPQIYSIKLKLPRGLTCSQCVLQWKYNAGNSYGVSSYGQTCKGCGQQEQFYGCADIAIGHSETGSQQSGSYQPYVPNNVAVRPQLPLAVVGGSSTTCTAAPAFRRINQQAADNWCISNCRRGNCPPFYCNSACQSLRVYG